MGKIFEKETVGTGLAFNFWKNKTSQTLDKKPRILRLKFDFNILRSKIVP